jgi:hypothetical protein
MAVPWLVVGNLVLSNLDKIMSVVRPGFTRNRIETLAQTDLLNQQIAELQSASAANAEQVRQLAAELKQVVAALEQAGMEATEQRVVIRRLAVTAFAVALFSLGLAVAALLR